MNWEHHPLDGRGNRDVYLDGHLIKDVLAASPAHGMVKVADRCSSSAVRLNGDQLAFQIHHGHVRVERRPWST